ncbi:unnamed protein product [Echinostoma caproni]|uniref:Mon2_C domain-containing protein n=1 Tax=Echinostoma caproni TaxID=27848 RepID=A0A183AQM0_9TREM|nr:unnamed protein product [Echinostoma caproni]
MRVICDKQRFGSATRRNAVIAMSNLIGTAVALDDEMLTFLCVEVHNFVNSCFGGDWTPLMNMLWHLLLSTTETYVRCKILAQPDAETGDLETDGVDSDGDTVEYNTLVCALIEFISQLSGIKRCRTKLTPYLSNVCLQLARLMQLPRSVIDRWLTNLGEFIEESDESLGYSVRLTTLDVLQRFALRFSNWNDAFHNTLSQLFAHAEEQHSKGDPFWWTSLEVALYLCGSFPRSFTAKEKTSMSKDVAALGLDIISSRYVMPSLQQTGTSVFVFVISCA